MGSTLSASICHLGGPLGKPVVPFCQIHIPKVQFWWHYISSFRPSVAPQYLPNELHTPYLLIQGQHPSSSHSLAVCIPWLCIYTILLYILYTPGLAGIYKPLHWSHPPQWTVAPCGQETSIFCMIRAGSKKWSRIRVQWCVKLNLCKNNRNYTRRTLCGCVFKVLPCYRQGN